MVGSASMADAGGTPTKGPPVPAEHDRRNRHPTPAAALWLAAVLILVALFRYTAAAAGMQGF